MKKKNIIEMKPKDIKTCPLLDRNCSKKDCAFYYVDFEKCLIEVLSYNLYALKMVFKDYINKE